MVTKEDLAQAILELRNSNLELKHSSIELKKSQEQADRRQEQADKRLDKVAKLMGNISNNQGDIAEEFFYNSLAAKPILAGIHYDFIDKNTTRRKSNIEDEYDILMVNGKDIAIIETKYKAHVRDIEKLVHKKYENFKKLYPEYKNYTHHLGLASFNINEEVKEEAFKNNVILLQRKGDLIETILPLEK